MLKSAKEYLKVDKKAKKVTVEVAEDMDLIKELMKDIETMGAEMHSFFSC